MRKTSFWLATCNPDSRIYYFVEHLFNSGNTIAHWRKNPSIGRETVAGNPMDPSVIQMKVVAPNQIVGRVKWQSCTIWQATITSYSSKIKTGILLAAFVAGGILTSTVSGARADGVQAPERLRIAKHVEVVLLGDSLTQWGDWDQLLPGVDHLNLGIAGQRTVQIEARLDEVLAFTPSTVVLLTGTNDILQHVPQAVTFDSYFRIVNRLRGNRVRIVTNALPYLGAQYRDADQLNLEIASLNLRLKGLAQARGFEFVDLPRLMPNPSLFRVPDGIHFNAAAYQIWATALKPLLPHSNG